MSVDVKMAWRNVWRNPRRSILTILAIAFATTILVFMLSWQFGSYETMINSAVKLHTGHLQIQAKEYRDKRNIRLTVNSPKTVGRVLENTPGIAAYTFRANAFSMISSEKRTYGALVSAIDPLREAGVSSLKDLIRKGSYLSADDTNQAMVGRLLAKNLQVDLGDELVLLGQGRDGSIAATAVKVKGVFSSGQDEFDRQTIHVPLLFFQQVYTMAGTVHSVVVFGKSLDQVSQIKRSIKATLKNQSDMKGLSVLDWTELMPGLIEAIKMDLVSGFVFYIILIVVVAFSILNTFLMAIFERTREFGVLMAIGTTPGRLTKGLLLESASMTMLGILVGIVTGSLITWYFQVHGIAISGASELLRQYGLPERIYPQLSCLSVSIGAGIVSIITFLTALYPSFRVKRLKPVQAMMAV